MTEQGWRRRRRAETKPQLPGSIPKFPSFRRVASSGATSRDLNQPTLQLDKLKVVYPTRFSDELIRPRRLCLRRELPEPGAHNFACGANYHIPVWFNFACGANYHIPGWFNYACGANYHIPGWFNYACGANYPYQALKGGLFCICVESTNLT